MAPKHGTETVKDIIKRLLADGWTREPGKGDHIKFTKPGSKPVIVDNRRGDIPKGTLRNIYRMAGWEW